MDHKTKNRNGQYDVCDLMIIGAGMAGVAAALFTANKNIDVMLVGKASGLGFSSGLIDLLGVHPLKNQEVVTDPWKAIARLCRTDPSHPYSRLKISSIKDAIEAILDFLRTYGYPYQASPNKNVYVPTPAGTVKPTYAVPHTMSHGPIALHRKDSCLVVGINGLRGFSAHQITQSLNKQWPGLRPVDISFPNMDGDLYVERIARAMDVKLHRRKLADTIRPHLKDARCVAIPAVLGIYETVTVMEEMERALGVPIFEVPTLLPAVSGMRLQNIFFENLSAQGIRMLFPNRVVGVSRERSGRWLVEVESASKINHRIVAKSVILGSGRFLGMGLHADRHRIRETIFNLPVSQPSKRASWHRRNFFSPAGHAINRAGVKVDSAFRPVDESGQPFYDNLFAAGTILANQDWMRQKCGCGLSIATAYGATKHCLSFLG
jgi:glycerol-3-phosphate dehydrogenase subunit B